MNPGGSGSEEALLILSHANLIPLYKHLLSACYGPNSMLETGDWKRSETHPHHPPKNQTEFLGRQSPKGGLPRDQKEIIGIN